MLGRGGLLDSVRARLAEPMIVPQSHPTHWPLERRSSILLMQLLVKPLTMSSRNFVLFLFPKCLRWSPMVISAVLGNLQ